MAIFTTIDWLMSSRSRLFHGCHDMHRIKHIRIIIVNSRLSNICGLIKKVAYSFMGTSKSLIRLHNVQSDQGDTLAKKKRQYRLCFYKIILS